MPNRSPKASSAPPTAAASEAMASKRTDIRSFRYASDAGDVGRSTTSTTPGSAGHVSGMSAITGNLVCFSARFARRIVLFRTSRMRTMARPMSAPPIRPMTNLTLWLLSLLLDGRLTRWASCGVPGKITWYPVDVAANGESDAALALTGVVASAAAWAAACCSRVLPSSLA